MNKQRAIERAYEILQRHGWQNIVIETPFEGERMRTIVADNGHSHPLLKVSVHVIIWEAKQKRQAGRLRHVHFSGLCSDQEPKRWSDFDIWAGVLVRRYQEEAQDDR